MGAAAYSHSLTFSNHFRSYSASQPPPALRHPTRTSFASRGRCFQRRGVLSIDTLFGICGMDPRLKAQKDLKLPLNGFDNQGVQEITKKLEEFSCYNVSLHPRNPLRSTLFDTKNLVFRRLFLLGTISSTLATYASAALADMMVKADLSRFRKTQSGVKIQDVIEGIGPEAKKGDKVEFNCVCRRANGYFVYSTVNQFSGESSPISLTLGSGKVIRGLEEVLQGMKPGGKRRALIPPNLGYVILDLEPQPQEFGPQRSLISHAKEPLVFEVQLLKVR